MPLSKQAESNNFTLKDSYQIKVPQLSRRDILAAMSLMGLGIQGCGSSSGTASNNSSQSSASGLIVSTFAGSTTAGTQDGTGTAATFRSPQGVAVDSNGTVYVADTDNHQIRKITSAGVVTTFAGISGSSGSGDGQGTAAEFYGPTGLALDASGNLYVADTQNHLIRKITPSGAVTTVAGVALSPGFVDGPANSARFYGPRGIAVAGDGSIYVADSANNKVRKIFGTLVTTLAGNGAGSADGTGTGALFSQPDSIAIDSSGTLFVSDMGNYTIRKITTQRVVTTLAGTAGTAGSVDGTGSSAIFRSPRGIALSSDGELYVADTLSNNLRKISVAGVTNTIGTSVPGLVDGGSNVASLYYPLGIATHDGRTFYVADAGNNAIRKVVI